jgi:hypothetical protein
MMRTISTKAPLALGLALAAALIFIGTTAQANHFDNSSIDDVDFGPTNATGGSNLDYNRAQFAIGISSSGGSFGSGSSSRYVYSTRSVQGSFSNSDGSTKRVFVEWMMTEPDTSKRSRTGAKLTQKSQAVVRVTLYTTSGTVAYGYSELEDCGVRAMAVSPRDSESPTSVRMTLTCKRGALEDMGFSEDEIDCIEEALESRSRSFRYVWAGTPD